jgi:TRAP-type C4-dicarboxylate transport system substrate-binding protein
MKNVKIKWLIAHQPERLFLRTANAFANALQKKKTNSMVELEIHTMSTYTEKYGAPRDHLLNLLNDGEIQMTQTEVSAYGLWNRNFMVFDLPFLFRDHDHCTRVVEGKIGQAMCQNLANNANMRGLAFTYSGGYRVIGSNEPINSLEDLKNLRVLSSLANPISQETLAALGAVATPHGGSNDNHGYAKIEDGLADATETTYIRFQGKHVLKTNHSMFLTTIAINNEFYQGLDSDLQQAIAEAALEAGHLERQWSIDEAQEFEEKCIENGVSITELSAAEMKEFRDSVMKVYDTWESQFPPGMIDHIRMQ